MANYTRDGLPPVDARDYQLWQFSDRKSVDGIHCGVDMNVMFTEYLK
jgi:GH25 family lysozyme M1 (1,4-beta-N-acetylmuramidase)